MRVLAADTVAPATDERSFFRQVFAWMAVGLLVTGVIAGVIGTNARALHALFEGNGRFILISALLIELVLVGGLVTLVQRMDYFEAAAMFLAYAALNGLTLSFIFATFTTKSIFTTFLVTAGMFGALALYGAATDADLTSWRSFLVMALIGQLIGLAVNIFWLNETLYWVTTAVGVLLFSAFTAYDVQRLKRYEPPPGSGVEVAKKDAIVGALALYLDFVNLFLYLLRIFGRRK